MAHALFAPMIVWQGMEDEYRDEDKMFKVKTSRLAKLASGDFSETATDYEMAIFISTFTLVQPPSESVFKLMAYCFRKAYGDKTADELDLPKVDLESDIMLKRDYDRLATWIYQKQKEAMKAKRQPKVEPKAESLDSFTAP
jgi:hypothetical protein